VGIARQIPTSRGHFPESRFFQKKRKRKKKKEKGKKRKEKIFFFPFYLSFCDDFVDDMRDVIAMSLRCHSDVIADDIREGGRKVAFSVRGRCRSRGGVLKDKSVRRGKDESGHFVGVTAFGLLLPGKGSAS